MSNSAKTAKDKFHRNHSDVAPDEVPIPLTVSVHSTATICRNVELEDDSTVGAKASARRGSSLGERSFLGAGAELRRLASVGESSFLGDGVIVMDGVAIGAGCLIESGTIEKNVPDGSHVVQGVIQ